MIIILIILSTVGLLLYYINPADEDNAAYPGLDKETREKLIKKYHMEKPSKPKTNIFHGDFGTSIK